MENKPIRGEAATVLQRLAEIKKKRAQAAPLPPAMPQEKVEVGTTPTSGRQILLDLKARASRNRAATVEAPAAQPAAVPKTQAPSGGVRPSIKASLDHMFDWNVVPTGADDPGFRQLRRPQVPAEAAPGCELTFEGAEKQRSSVAFHLQLPAGQRTAAPGETDVSGSKIVVGGTEALNPAEMDYLIDALHFKFAEQLTSGQANTLNQALNSALAIRYNGQGKQACVDRPKVGATAEPPRAAAAGPPTRGSELYDKLSATGRIFSGTEFGARIAAHHPTGSTNFDSEDYEMQRQSRMVSPTDAGPAEGEKHITVHTDSGKFGIEFVVGKGSWVEPQDSTLRRVGSELFLTGGPNDEAKRVFYFDSQGPARGADVVFNTRNGGKSQNLRIPVLLYPSNR